MKIIFLNCYKDFLRNIFSVILLQMDSNRHLEWLKTIQKAHGSVEVSSLAQAEAINSGGVFSCGYVWKIQDDIVLVRLNKLFYL